MKHNPFEIAFGIVLAVCLCVAPIIIFTSVKEFQK